MTLRQALPKALGLTTAGIILIAATQLLLLSFEADPLIDQSLLDDLTGWIERRPRVGAGILVGLALIACSLVLFWVIARSLGTDRKVITTRRLASGGWTKVDRATLEDVIERRLEAIDRRNTVRVNVDRRGRVNLSIVTPDLTATGPISELRDALDTLCSDGAMPCHPGRVTATTPRRRHKRAVR